MKLWIFVFLIPFFSCRGLKDEPLEPTDDPTEEPIPEGLTFKPVGCFRDIIEKGKVRAMPQLLKNFRGTIDWSDLSKIVQKCADEAMKQRQEYFGVQYWGECWGGEDADETYNMYGENPQGCYDNVVGMDLHNMVYKFELPE